MIKTETLRCFATVAQLGNLSDAANRLGRTQSAVSMTLKNLEDHLGARLFETDRKNRLTPLGQEVFGLAQRQLRQFDDTVEAIEIAAAAPQGNLRIAAIPSAAGLALPEAVQTMADRFPRLTLEIRDMDTQLVIESLLDGRADVGIVSGAPSLNGIRTQTLFSDAFGLLCARDHPLAASEKQPTVNDVFAHAFVKNALCANVKAPQVRQALTSTRVTVHNTHSLIAMVRSGIWVTILPQSVAQAAPNELVFRPMSGFDERRTVSLVIRERTRFPDLVQAFANILKDLDWKIDMSTADKDPPTWM